MGKELQEKQGYTGAKVMYCGHDGWFMADLVEVEGAVVVKANDPVTPDNIVRGHNGEATHHMSDFPGPVFWAPHRGVFVVPAGNIRKWPQGKD